MYNQSKQDFANRLINLAKEFTALMDEYAAEKKYYNAVLQGENAIATDETIVNGITGADIIGLITAFDAVETNATTNFLYTNFNAVQ